MIVEFANQLREDGMEKLEATTRSSILTLLMIPTLYLLLARRHLIEIPEED